MAIKVNLTGLMLRETIDFTISSIENKIIVRINCYDTYLVKHKQHSSVRNSKIIVGNVSYFCRNDFALTCKA